MVICVERIPGGNEIHPINTRIIPAYTSTDMDLALTDKIVVVTGASKGIGYACAAAFAGEGARVVLVSRSTANLDVAMAKFPKSRHAPRAIVADLVHADQATRMVDEVESGIGAIDILVNSAGAARRSACR